MFQKLRRSFSALTGAVLLVLAAPLLAEDTPAEDAPAAAAETASVGGSAFVISNIAVDVSAKSAEAARIVAFREAAKRAWPQLWARMTGSPADSAPRLPDSAVEGMVSGIEVEREHYSSTRYIASLGVVFDRNQAGERLPESARILQSRPLLLLPLLVDGGVRTVYEGNSPWQQAWARFGTDSSPIDYIRATGKNGDAVLLNGWQARRDNRLLWRSILSRYGAENLLVAEAHLDRSYPGGPIVGTFLARHGPDSEILARFRLKAGAAGELDTMLDTAVSRIDAAYAEALQTGKLRSEAALTLELGTIGAVSPILDEADGMIGARGVSMNVVTPDAATWSALEAAINSVPEVDELTILSLSVGGTSQIRISYSADYGQLRYALDQRGLRLEPGESGLRLRRRAAGEIPLPAPAAPPSDFARGPRDILSAPKEEPQ